MGVDQLLKQIIATAEEIQAELTGDRTGDLDDAADDLSSWILELHTHLDQGGELPRDWER